MRIGINALAWVPDRQAGMQTYLCQLVRALQEVDSDNEYIVFVGREAEEQLELRNENFREVVCTPPSRSRILRAVWEQVQLPRRARAEQVEVLLCTGGIVPGNLDMPAVQVIHDLQVFHYPENFSWLKRNFLRKMLPRSARAASVTVADSEYTRGDVVKLLPQRRADTRVALLAGSPEYQPTSTEAIAQVRRRYQLSDEYLLSVGTSHLHKNLHGLVEAYERADVTAELVLVGRRGSGQHRLMRAVNEAKRRRQIKLLGRVANSELAALYTGASSFVFPSLFEGFGMPVLEAMQCGCPVACSSLTALSEVAGPAALLFNPRDQQAFTAAIQRLLTEQSLRERLREKGFARAGKFDWRQTASATIEALFDAVA